jgi:hypothetical protein
MSRLTHRVLARFPDHELAIERLARSSESFRAMCEEYTVGAEALEGWQQSAQRAAEVAELRESLAELEEEILEALQEEAKPRLDQRLRTRGR